MAKISIAAGQLSGNLNFRAAQKMIHQFLTQDRIKTALDNRKVINPALCDEPIIIMKAYTKEELAKKLGITSEELEKLKSPDFYTDMANKISLPLICLYGATKFADVKHKSK